MPLFFYQTIPLQAIEKSQHIFVWHLEILSALFRCWSWVVAALAFKFFFLTKILVSPHDYRPKQEPFSRT